MMHYEGIDGIIAIVPARGGSKGIPWKNIRPFYDGHSLLDYTIGATRGSKYISRVIVSTESEQVSEVAYANGAEVIFRPPEMATDISPSEDALKHVLSLIPAKIVVMLQPTSPLRLVTHIDGAIEKLIVDGYDSLLSVVPMHEFYWLSGPNGSLAVNYGPHGERPMRQDRHGEYVENGSIYVFRPWVLEQFGQRLGGKIGLYEMPPWTRYEVDTPDDMELCKWIIDRYREGAYE